MSRGTFLYSSLWGFEDVFGEKRHSYEKSYNFGVESPAIALWRLATNGDYRTIAHLFGVSRASDCLIAQDVCAAMQVLLPKYIQTFMVSVCKVQLMVSLVSGNFPSVLVPVPSSIFPSCHPAQLTLIIGKGSIQSSYKL